MHLVVSFEPHRAVNKRLLKGVGTTNPYSAFSLVSQKTAAINHKYLVRECFPSTTFQRFELCHRSDFAQIVSGVARWAGPRSFGLAIKVEGFNKEANSWNLAWRFDVQQEGGGFDELGLTGIRLGKFVIVSG